MRLAKGRRGRKNLSRTLSRVSIIVIINRRGPLSTTSRRDPFFFFIIRCHLSGSRGFVSSGGRH